jgi:leader peptidase (prepilin peptidase) / N-methyltransferase
VIVIEVAAAFAGGLVLAAVIWAVADLQIFGIQPNEPPFCSNCSRPLDLRARVPLWGFRPGLTCPHCKSLQSRWRIRWEFAVACLVAWLMWQWEPTATFRSSVILITPLLLILLIDLRARMLFLNNLYLAIIVGLFMGLFDGLPQVSNAFFGMLMGLAIGGLFFILSRWIFRSMALRVASIGLGDIYVAAAVGATVRANDVVRALFLSVVLAFIALFLLPILFPETRRHALPFGSFLCLGAIASFTY